MFSANLTSDGGVKLNTPNPYIIFGEQAVGLSERTKSLAALLTVDGFEARSSDVAMQDMWEKWASIATMSSASGLMRAAVGDILHAPGGRKLLLDLLQETFAVATAAGFKPRPAFGEFLVTFFTTEGIDRRRLTVARHRTRRDHRGRDYHRPLRRPHPRSWGAHAIARFGALPFRRLRGPPQT
jgi:ketopantoate reductase